MLEEVHEHFSKYDHSIFLEDVFIFIDASERYLIVEPYSLKIGDNANYVLSNFCPSITDEKKRRELDRYKSGSEFLQKGAKANRAYCTAMSDTMHVCRDKIGDGTLLTGIWDASTLEVTFYFYHNYTNGKPFKLEDELAKGDHSIDIKTPFPKNAEFEKLKTYIAPFNTPWIRITLAILGFFYLVSALYFASSAIRIKSQEMCGFRLLLALFS